MPNQFSNGFPVIPPGNGGSGSNQRLLDLSVNAAAVDKWTDGSVVLRCGARINLGGSFTGGGIGNKSVMGIQGFNGLPLGDLDSVEFTWENLTGPAGPVFNPPGAPTVLAPYVNLIVDFGGGNIRILVLMDASLNALISASIGTYSNPGGLNVITYSWDSTKNCLIVNAPPDATPGGVLPNISVGAGWPEKSYKMSDLVTAVPSAKLVDVFPGNSIFPAAASGLAAGARIPGIILVSGDSANITRSGKKFTEFLVNGENVLNG